MKGRRETAVNKTALLILLVYFAMAGSIFASDWLSSEKPVVGEKIVPIMLSVVLLAPLWIWYRSFRKHAVLSNQIGKEVKNSIWLGVLALFFLAMAVRLPSILLFANAYEKTPLIYLVVLTVILVKKEKLGLYGVRTERFGRSLAIGLVYYLSFELVGFVALNAMTFAYAGQAFYGSFDLASFLLVFPFMTFCVGISEEGLFRGFMQTRFNMAYGWKKAVFTQAALFGLWHFAWHLSPLDFEGMALHILSAFLIGLIFGYFYHVSKMLTPLILAHGLVDSVPYGLVTNQAIAPEESPFILMQLIAAAVSLIALAVSTKFLANKIRTNQEMI
jgi:membrane protease YdiL (CAAX protease family)